MMQYILFIQKNTKTTPSPEEWNRFFIIAQESGLFEGGSAICKKLLLGDAPSAKSSDHIGGFMRFSSNDKQKLLELLKEHPVVVHGGSVELFEMPKS